MKSLNNFLWDDNSNEDIKNKNDKITKGRPMQANCMLICCNIGTSPENGGSVPSYTGSTGCK